MTPLTASLTVKLISYFTPSPISKIYFKHALLTNCTGFISFHVISDKSAVSLLYWGRKERMSLKIKINIVCKVFGKYIVAKFTYFITTCHGGWKSFHTRMLKKSFKSNNLISHTQGIRYGFLTRRTDDVPTLQSVLPGNYYKHGAWVGECFQS